MAEKWMKYTSSNTVKLRMCACVLLVIAGLRKGGPGIKGEVSVCANNHDGELESSRKRSEA